MNIPREHFETAAAGLEILIKRNEKAIKTIRENEELKRRNPFLKIAFADPEVQDQADREDREGERGLHGRLANRKAALRAIRAALR